MPTKGGCGTAHEPCGKFGWGKLRHRGKVSLFVVLRIAVPNDRRSFIVQWNPDEIQKPPQAKAEIPKDQPWRIQGGVGAPATGAGTGGAGGATGATGTGGAGGATGATGGAACGTNAGADVGP